MTARPSSSWAQNSPGSSTGACSSATKRPAVQRLGRLARLAALEAEDRPLVGAGAADDLAEVVGMPSVSSRGRGSRT